MSTHIGSLPPTCLPGEGLGLRPAPPPCRGLARGGGRGNRPHGRVPAGRAAPPILRHRRPTMRGAAWCRTGLGMRGGPEAPHNDGGIGPCARVRPLPARPCPPDGGAALLPSLTLSALSIPVGHRPPVFAEGEAPPTRPPGQGTGERPSPLRQIGTRPRARASSAG